MAQALAAGFTRAQFAAASGHSPSAVTQWINGPTRSLGVDAVVGLATLTGWNVKWWTEGVGSRETATRPAHGVSLNDGTVTLTTDQKLSEWGNLVEMKTLPDTFEALLPDDAMAPEYPRGMRVEFERAESAEFGEMVIVRDRTGNLHFRRYEQVPGGWIGARDRTGFMELQPERDGARIVAVMTAYTRRTRPPRAE